MEPKHHIVTLENLRMHNAHACYPQEKWPIVCMAIQGRERSIFQRKHHKFRARSVRGNVFTTNRTPRGEI